METHRMDTNRVLFADFLHTAFDNGDYSTDDVIAFVLPLFREVLNIHESGKVAAFEKDDALFLTDGTLDTDEDQAHFPLHASSRVQALFSDMRSRGLEIIGKVKLKTDVGNDAVEAQDLQIHTHLQEPLHQAAYLPGYRSFEQLIGHHDPQTDIFCLGLILGSMAMSLDLYSLDNLHEFVRLRTNPSFHFPRIHTTIGRLITEMTALDRARRSQDLYDVINRLEHYRDYDPEKQTDLSKIAGWMHTPLKEKDAFILNKLRNRLFDTSRRNRLLYYKPNMRFVNLTVSSVPIVLHYQSIRPELLFTWNSELAEKITGMKEIVLNKYLRFEDHGYLPSSLDRIRIESQRAIQEYGFSQLKLVIAFLNWHNLKENPRERIQSPLLLLPVTLKKNKKVKEDHFVLKVLDNTAEVNPVLANQLKELYGIRLPDFIDLDEMSPDQFYQHVKAQIEEANQGIVLHYIDKPRIRLIHSEARQTVNNYRKRLRQQGEVSGYQSIPYSYDPENYKPLGLEIFHQRIEPKTSSLQFLVDPTVKMRSRQLVDAGVRQEGATVQQPTMDAPVREREIFELADSENNPYSWDFDVCHMVLGNFNYKKMSLVRDYNVVIDKRLQHHVFEALFSEEPRVFPRHGFDLNKPDDWYHVITADPTQTRAILQSRAGYNYIIQGPPGTGKSQTITNLIADFVARGKNILFVCEKRAALDVVYHRLKQVGLEELCCYIHDSQGDKREFIKNLKATYEEFTQHKMDFAGLKVRRQLLLDKMNAQLELFRAFHTTSQLEGKDAGMVVRDLIERIILLRSELTPLSPQQEELLPSYKDWQTAAPVLTELQATLDEMGAEPVFSMHPFSRIQESILSADNPLNHLEQALAQALQLLDDLEGRLQATRLGPGYGQDFDKLKNLVQFAVLLLPFSRTGQMNITDPDREEARRFAQRLQQYRDEQEVYQQAEKKNAYWSQKLDEQELDAALLLAAKCEGSFFSLFNGSWQKLKKQIAQRYDLSQHAVKPTYKSLLESLKAEYTAKAKAEQSCRQLEKDYQLDSLDRALLSIDTLHNKKGHPELAHLMQHPDASTLVASLEALHQPLNKLEIQLKRCLQEMPSGGFSLFRDELQNIQLNAEGLREWLPVLRAFAGLSPAVKSTLRHLPLRIAQAEAAVARKSLQDLYHANRAFSGIDRLALEKAVQLLAEGYTSLLALNADVIRAFVRQRFVEQVELSGRPASQLNEEQKKLKRSYTEGRKILENEFGKSMRYKSIRELSEKESGLVLKDLKPVWLMSPYSVSDSLPLDIEHFDVVIFDEASQITLEEGVPALYRSGQTIIVGDEKQMPPTDFFSARTEDPDDMDQRDYDETSEWLSDDADSLLVQGARKLESTLLSWHYRSHYETLISYSNHAFYEGHLLTIPDKTIHHQEKAAIRVSQPTEAVTTADHLFDRSISFHMLPDSVYEKRSNIAEADYIAHLVRELLTRKTKESIGIVAFSQEQQHAIENALDKLAGNDAGFNALLEDAYNRMENDQFTGLIIKNLENIQGDERDIIIMSVCYGPDGRRRMLMNFGPVNKKGGEKRLNVLFSRARKHMAVVSSIRYDQITNEYNEGANYLRRFLQYAELVSLGQMDMARKILDGLVPYKKESAENRSQPAVIRSQLKAMLLEMGYEVAEQVGQSNFKCSLAVKRKIADEAWTLAILIDDEQHYGNSNLMEQYYQRPAILKAFGWKVLPVFAKDWLHHPQQILDQIRKLLSDTAGAGGAPSGDAEAAMDGNMGARTGTYDHLDFQQFLLRDGQTDKFWEIATEDNKLIIRWGKVGTKGQIQQKTLSDKAAAEKEMEKLIQEIKGKGYLGTPL